MRERLDAIVPRFHKCRFAPYSTSVRCVLARTVESEFDDFNHSIKLARYQFSRKSCWSVACDEAHEG